MVKSTVIKISDPENRLINAMRKVCFGEMYGVDIEAAEPQIEVTLPPQLQDLILYIRTGIQYIDVLTIHNGLPTHAETDLKIDGYRCRRKVRFPSR